MTVKKNKLAEQSNTIDETKHDKLMNMDGVMDMSCDHHLEMDEVMDMGQGNFPRIKTPPKLIINGVSEKVHNSADKDKNKGKLSSSLALPLWVYSNFDIINHIF